MPKIQIYVTDQIAAVIAAESEHSKLTSAKFTAQQTARHLERHAMELATVKRVLEGLRMLTEETTIKDIPAATIAGFTALPLAAVEWCLVQLLAAGRVKRTWGEGLTIWTLA